jgi:hypothetical protein
MSTALIRPAVLGQEAPALGLSYLTLPNVRLNMARALVLFCFVWPYFNYTQMFADSTMEINFLPVFLAALIVPEVTLQSPMALLLALPSFGIAIIWAAPTAPLRLAIGILPLIFILNLTRHLRERGQTLIPGRLAYRLLKVFVLFSLLQSIDMNYLHIIPTPVTQALIFVLPRYSGEAYDDSGIRGVQGWASEPSGAAVMCIALALLAIDEKPELRWRILGLYGSLALLNKSVYSLVLLLMLTIGCLSTLKHKRYAWLAGLPACAGVIFMILHSSRIAELQSNLLVDGMSRESNHELARFGQIFFPLQQFPLVYKPPILFGSIVMEPMGLVPLVLGYGSVFGLIWIGYILLRYFRLRTLQAKPLAIISSLVLLMMTAPDFIPAVAAFAAFATFQKRHTSTKAGVES